MSKTEKAALHLRKQLPEAQWRMLAEYFALQLRGKAGEERKRNAQAVLDAAKGDAPVIIFDNYEDIQAQGASWRDMPLFTAVVPNPAKLPAGLEDKLLAEAKYRQQFFAALMEEELNRQTHVSPRFYQKPARRMEWRQRITEGAHGTYQDAFCLP